MPFYVNGSGSGMWTNEEFQVHSEKAVKAGDSGRQHGAGERLKLNGAQKMKPSCV